MQVVYDICDVNILSATGERSNVSGGVGFGVITIFLFLLLGVLHLL